MNWMHYLVEANLYLAAFYALYLIFLRSETHYQLNRAYLLGTSALAFAIPLIQLGILKPVVHATGQISVGSLQGTYSVVLAAPQVPNWTMNDYILLAYGTIALALLIHLLIRVYLLMALLKKGSVTKNHNYNIIELRQGSVAFSFFNNLFIDDRLASSQTILHHEQVHIRQKHSWDIIYLEFVKIINWFNPVVYLLIASIKEVHEFIADEETARLENNNDCYTDFLISNAYGITQNSLTNSFFNKNLLKRRITMLYQKKSGKAARLKYLLALPLMAGLLCLSTMAFTTKTYALVDLAPSNSVKFAITTLLSKHKKGTDTVIQAGTNNQHIKVTDIILSPPVIAGNSKNSKPVKITDILLSPPATGGNTSDKSQQIVNMEPGHPNTQTDTIKVNSKPVFSSVEVLPQFPGGAAELSKFLQRTIRYPYEDHVKNIQGKVYIRFIVEPDGTIDNMKVLRTPSEAMGIESVRAMGLSPKWIPGMQNDQPVRTEFTLPINFSQTPPPPAPPVNPSDNTLALTPPPPVKVINPTTNQNVVFTAVETQPQFPGGEAELVKFLQKNIHYPALAKQNKVQGKVYVQFIVEKDGSIADIKVLREPGSGTGDEAVRIMKLSPKWIPGKQNGQPVRVQFTLPIEFSLGY